MKTSNLFIAQQCDQAGEITELEQCIASGQVSAAQVEAHRMAGEVHSCSLYCEQPVCIKAQQDEYRQKLIDAQPATTELAAEREKVRVLRKALQVIRSQSIADDWTAAEAMGFIKAHAATAITQTGVGK